MTDTEYYDLIRPYDDAMKLLLTRLEILNHNIYKASAENPIHTMQYRIKSKQSIEEKLIRKGEEPTLENAKDLLQDIAGIRIVCYFVGDIKNLIDMLKKQSDLIFIRERDYITNPKPNGYRSHHIILGVNVFCLDASEYYPSRSSSARFPWISGLPWSIVFLIKKNTTTESSVLRNC